MGDRVAVMRKGELQQVAPPQELYDRPVNLFVGGFIGSPAMNLVEATLERANGGVNARWPAASGSRSPTRCSRRGPALKRYEGAKVVLGIRPEDLEDAALRPTRRRPAPARRGRAAGGARLGDHGALHGRRPAGADRGRPRARGGRRRRARAPRRREARDDGRAFRRPFAVREGETAEVASTPALALLRSRDGSRDLRERRGKGAVDEERARPCCRARARCCSRRLRR